MKTNSIKYMSVSMFLLSSLIIGFGCAKKDSGGGDAAPQTNNVFPNGGGTSPTPNGWGDKVGVASLDVDSLATFSEYTNRPMNNPTNVKVMVDMKKASQGFYSGQMQISYTDIDYNGVAHNYNGTFYSGGATEKAVNDDVYVNQWNHFYNHNINGVTTPFFKAFFEDALGGMLLVVDYVDDLGMQGSVYFRNYRPTTAPKSPSRCWFVKIGPYECRDFLVNDSIRPDLVQYPTVFQRLGKFVGMDRWKALKN